MNIPEILQNWIINPRLISLPPDQRACYQLLQKWVGLEELFFVCFAQILGRKQTNAEAEFLKVWSSNQLDQTDMESLVKNADTGVLPQMHLIITSVGDVHHLISSAGIFKIW